MFLLIGLVTSIVEVTDPGYKLSYHLKNTGQFHGIPGEDINVEPVWEKGYTGKNVHINFIIDGCFYNNPDLIDRFNSTSSYNYITNSRDVSFVSPESLVNGNTIIGFAVASKNGIGMIGVAYDANFSVLVPFYKSTESFSFYVQQLFYNYLDYDIRVDYISFNTKSQSRHASINSFRYSPLVEEHLEDALYRGRKRKGIIYVIPSLIQQYDINGILWQSLFSHCGQVICVASTNHYGSACYNSLPSCEILINAPGYGSFYYGETSSFPRVPSVNGWNTEILTQEYHYSPAASIVAGVIAILIEANPELTYRDIQWVLLHSATKNDPNHDFWTRNSAGYDYNPYYGFGRIDADKALNLSKKWPILPRMHSLKIINTTISKLAHVYQEKIDIIIEVKESTLLCEYAYLLFDLKIPDITMLRIFVESPSGTRFCVYNPTIISQNNRFGFSTYNDNPFRILMRGFFGENITGKWRVSIMDSSYIVQNQILFCGIEFLGIKEFPLLPYVQKRNGHESENFFKEYKNKFLKVNSQFYSMVCGKKIGFTFSWTGPELSENSGIVPVFIMNQTSKRMFCIGNVNLHNETEKGFFLPCAYRSSEEFSIVFLFEEFQEMAVLQFGIINFNDNEVILPKPYQKQHTEVISSTTLSLYVAHNTTSVFEYGESSLYIISLYNYDSNQRLMSITTPFLWETSLFTVEDVSKSKNTVIIMSPIASKYPNECNSLLTPIHFTLGDSKTYPYSLDISGKCHINEDILVEKSNTTVPTTLSPNSGMLTVYIVSTLLTIFMIGNILALFYVLTKHKTISLDEHYLSH